MTQYKEKFHHFQNSLGSFISLKQHSMGSGGGAPFCLSTVFHSVSCLPGHQWKGIQVVPHRIMQ